MFKNKFRDKVVLITGGSSGIGRVAALRFAAYGAKVSVVARGAEALDAVVREIAFLGGEATAIPGDVSNPEECRLAVEKTVARFGRLDIVICSAGLSMRTFFEGSDLAAMEAVMRVNFFGTLYITHYALPHVKQSRGSLVALSSLTGVRGIPSYSIYGASKYAVEGLYESLRLELRRDGVHVGVFAPGFVDTPLRTKVLGKEGRAWSKPPDPPFRIWSVEKCVSNMVRLIAWRRGHCTLPWYMGILFWLDDIVGRAVGNAVLKWKFPRL
jgi:dehydrogenase/reductase SDR family protein 7B